jgi:hypothetical protein
MVPRKVGIERTIKKNLIEILLQRDVANIDLVKTRMRSFKHSYFKHLKEINQEKLKTYLQLVKVYYKNPEVVLT